MKTITAIEFLRAKRLRQELEIMVELKDLIILASDGLMDESNFNIYNYMCEINDIESTDMLINIRNVSFEIDGLSFVEWLNKSEK